MKLYGVSFFENARETFKLNLVLKSKAVYYKALRKPGSDWVGLTPVYH